MVVYFLVHCLLNRQVGEQLPAVEVQEGEPGNKVAMDQLFKGKKGVLFAVPGAFTPGCSKVESVMSSFLFFFLQFAHSHLCWRCNSLVTFRLTSRVLWSRPASWRAKEYRRSLAFLSMTRLSWLPGEKSTEQMARYGLRSWYVDMILVHWPVCTRETFWNHLTITQAFGFCDNSKWVIHLSNIL